MPDVGHHRLGHLGHPLRGGHDGPHAETQPMHGVQVPLDGVEGQPGLLSEGGDQADQVDPQALLAQRHSLQLRRRHTAASAAGAGASDVGVFGDFHWNPG